MDDLLESIGVSREASGLDSRVVTATITEASADLAVCATPGDGTVLLPVTEYFADRRWHVGDTFLAQVISGGDRPTISVVRPELIEAIYAGVAPEIRSGAVRVMGSVRAPGKRSKLAVAATSDAAGVDPIAACIGRDAGRVRQVRDLIGGEKLEIVAWHPSDATYLANALAPAKVNRVEISGRDAVVFVDAHQMPVAVGDGGLNSVLAGQLVGLMVTVEAGR